MLNGEIGTDKCSLDFYAAKVFAKSSSEFSQYLKTKFELMNRGQGWIRVCACQQNFNLLRFMFDVFKVLSQYLVILLVLLLLMGF